MKGGSVADDSVVSKVADLLHEASETHHQVFRITGGTDEDWASWYADWLTKLSELPAILGDSLVRSEVVYLLVQLDKDYVVNSPEEPWEQYYATGFVAHFS